MTAGCLQISDLKINFPVTIVTSSYDIRHNGSLLHQVNE